MTGPKSKNKSAPGNTPALLTPFSCTWMVRRITEDGPEWTETHMRTWMNPKCHAEIDDELIGHLRKLSLEQLKAALEELRRSKKFVRGTKGNQLAVPTIIQTEDMSTQFALTALVDSGCTGSCIDIDVVRRFKIPTKKLKVPTPVYNADGTLNQLGKITDYVKVRMTIMDHSERMVLAVTKLGVTNSSLRCPSYHSSTHTFLFGAFPVLA